MNRLVPSLTGLATLCVGCTPSAETDAAPVPRFVLLYATCTLNKDYLQPYNETRLTPSLAAFSKESAVFTNHQTESGLSGRLPSKSLKRSKASATSSSSRRGVSRVFHPEKVGDRLRESRKVGRKVGKVGGRLRLLELMPARGVSPATAPHPQLLRGTLGPQAQGPGPLYRDTPFLQGLTPLPNINPERAPPQP